jgi:uncharacterized cupredoxin-like copper-binding protein
MSEPAFTIAKAARWAPSEIALKRGEMVRFEVKNSGKVMHEIVLGNMKN